MDFIGIGAPEVILVLLLVFVIFGPKRIVEMSRDAGKVLRSLSKDAAAMQRQLEDEFSTDKPGQPPGADKSTPTN
jgi:sec-independent protein translocase protein TatA